jgi:hypothetical protein
MDVGFFPPQSLLSACVGVPHVTLSSIWDRNTRQQADLLGKESLLDLSGWNFPLATSYLSSCLFLGSQNVCRKKHKP